MTRLALAAALALAATASLGCAATAQAQLPQDLTGVWSNPRDTVRVETRSCGEGLCGWVVAASAEAQAAAREAGTANLIGTEVLQDYRRQGPDAWQGQVFVPDRGARYYSVIRVIDANALRISGCILGGLICKSQIWRRA